MVFKRLIKNTPVLTPKKSLGQNFLRDKAILKKIADFAQIGKEDTVVEVGPGEGTLTAFLLEKASNVFVIEKDEHLAKLLAENSKNQISNNKLKIIAGDILEIENLLKIENYILVGNIPYYITGALFKKALESENQPKSMTFVVQKEVAERIMARDGKESILSISIKAYGTPEYGGTIKAGSFHPKPKVDSAIIAVRNISRERFEDAPQKNFSSVPCERDGASTRNFLARKYPCKARKRFFAGQQLEVKFFEILKAGFAHKRKLLVSNLEKFWNKKEIKEIFKKCGVSEKARAENLKVDDWLCLVFHSKL